MKVLLIILGVLLLIGLIPVGVVSCPVGGQLRQKARRESAQTAMYTLPGSDSRIALSRRRKSNG